MSGHDVTLEWPDGRSETVAVDPQETVLEAALREGIRLPYDCRKGTCTACVGRVRSVDGSRDESDESPDAASAVDYRRPPRALEESDRADGYALLCIAHPRADCCIEVGPMVRSQLGDSPWG
ncbi:2Fe-2S iron-sulfur cluster-binding protein [Natronococcus sp. A-GB7]|uniref:2Fe-2S iron-sulfur cluster-binding protein n=1 Tax=Natronococcus sp. A-GB7 TaxID=3037649 RepID=UPI00241E9658|nr:2Fe-2S iron-sulfur cluster-binding protein [Natronococcus sp. A-GB7]MDG5819649.1 2Fe-2S iron-sulfur cluster-binding protein [Natronococcus sp. A-GB7]